MKKLESILGWIVVISFILWAASAKSCPQNVTKVAQGAPAPCSGWHVSEPTMQQMMKTADELELQRKLSQSLEHLRKLDAAEIEFYKQKNEAHRKALSQSENKQFWVGAGAFALGVIVTGLAAKAAIEATR